MGKKNKGSKIVGSEGSSPVQSADETLATQAFPVSNTKSRATSRATNGPSLEVLKQNFKNMFTPITLPYKKARLNDCGGNPEGDWYFEWYYLVPGTFNQFKRFKERFDINRIKSRHGIAEAKKYGRIGVDYINRQLANGWNPFGQDIPGHLSYEEQLENVKLEILVNASPDKIRSIDCHMNRLSQFLESKSISLYGMGVFTGDHAQAFRKYLVVEKKLSMKTINESISYCKRFWRVATRLKYCQANPFDSVERVTQNMVAPSEEMFEPLTSEELEVIFKKFHELGEYGFINFLAMILYGWIRPKEITRLKVGDIDLKKGLIRFSKNKTKNRHAAYIQIVPELLVVLKRMNLETYPLDSYLFSGDGTGFYPGEKVLYRDRASERWRKVVKLGLKINKDMYGLKHTGNIDYLQSNKGNVDLKWQQMQNRHLSSAMTERYNRRLGIYVIEAGQINFTKINLFH